MTALLRPRATATALALALLSPLRATSPDSQSQSPAVSPTLPTGPVVAAASTTVATASAASAASAAPDTAPADAREAPPT
ncbi:MAG: TolC family protein, partial [Opitutaceae bacterium]|nr:TolC family protein [Opitutaceae bacterium]